MQQAVNTTVKAPAIRRRNSKVEVAEAPSAADNRPAATVERSSMLRKAATAPNVFSGRSRSNTTVTKAVSQDDNSANPMRARSNTGWQPKPSSKCVCCDKTVYEMEKVVADGKVYAKSCFRCAECKKTVSVGTYAALDGKIYCKPCFKKMFKLKGNYAEGFGQEQHKMKWQRAQSLGST